MVMDVALSVSGLALSAWFVTIGPSRRGEVTVVGIGRIGPSCMG